MSDDNNDKLMTAFIEKATPKLLEALSGQITAQENHAVLVSGKRREIAATLLRSSVPSIHRVKHYRGR